ncbi:hypothetical protein GWK47_027660 [Chionoecetes opilio]|uniref:Uncharacterized protein n=1 Tax=Chionoecetes opilio TaxID=41210 RepID=A0A8J8WKQ9_CHIOP|nr:hypothetical protein GWK47_027660 [Chionoecetes opilio]
MSSSRNFGSVNCLTREGYRRTGDVLSTTSKHDCDTMHGKGDPKGLWVTAMMCPQTKSECLKIVSRQLPNRRPWYNGGFYGIPDGGLALRFGSPAAPRENSPEKVRISLTSFKPFGSL